MEIGHISYDRFLSWQFGYSLAYWIDFLEKVAFLLVSRVLVITSKIFNLSEFVYFDDSHPLIEIELVVYAFNVWIFPIMILMLSYILIFFSSKM